ncbi:MAG: hypothetical protein Q4G70_08835 [Pseudomonadota bacterium]|nr:hypothetical protein [Pseudomonadota bacterium]
MRFALALLTSLAVGIGVGLTTFAVFLVLEVTLPTGQLCERMGGSFEGACSYMMMAIVLLAGVAAAVLYLIVRLIKEFSRPTAPAPASEPRGDAHAGPAPAMSGNTPPLSRLWWLSLALALLGLPMAEVLMWMFNASPTALQALRVATWGGIGFYILMSALELRKLGQQPVLALLALVPWVGVLAVAALVFFVHRARPTAGSGA